MNITNYNQRNSNELSKSSSHKSGSYIRESNSIDSSFDNRKELMKKKPTVGAKVDSNYIKERILQPTFTKTIQQQQSLRNAFAKEGDELSRSEKKFGSKPILDILLGRYTPKIIKSLAFTRSDQPMNKVFVKNKYAHLF